MTSILANQKLHIKQNNNPETSYEFRLAQVNHKDGLSLYSSVLNGSDRVDFISPENLHENVARHIIQSNYINTDDLFSQIHCKNFEEYWNKIKQGVILDGSPVLKVLASLYPNYLFCFIFKITNEYGKIVIEVVKYVENISSYKKCVFIYYDGIANHYSPLYLYNKNNEEEEKSNFKYDDQIMRSLLFKFIQQKLEYNDNIDFEEINRIDQPAPPLPNENSGNISDSIMNNNAMDASPALENHENTSISNTTPIYVSSTSNTNKDDYTSTETSRSASETTNGFFRQPTPTDGNCLFASICNILCTCENITPASLRKQATNYNRRRGKIDEECLLSETGNRLEQYCDKMEKTNAWGGEAEIRAIAESHDIIIRVVNVNPQKLCVSISEHPLTKT
ncbi:unnamed protein product [Rotaria sp. Silwood1]|nr:unnamed protein product [Rotaria sp. Silwood1]CAF3923472.1 unnamed protein product [Rotaria sp. Silwood1]CAF4838561.1 unnamed protein product [Rotaria sp. Silwood1]